MVERVKREGEVLYDRTHCSGIKCAIGRGREVSKDHDALRARALGGHD